MFPLSDETCRNRKGRATQGIIRGSSAIFERKTRRFPPPSRGGFGFVTVASYCFLIFKDLFYRALSTCQTSNTLQKEVQERQQLLDAVRQPAGGSGIPPLHLTGDRGRDQSTTYPVEAFPVAAQHNIQAVSLKAGGIRQPAAVFDSRKKSCIEHRRYRNKFVPLAKNNSRNTFPSDYQQTACSFLIQIGKPQKVSPVPATPAR